VGLGERGWRVAARPLNNMFSPTKHTLERKKRERNNEMVPAAKHRGIRTPIKKKTLPIDIECLLLARIEKQLKHSGSEQNK
jgi:hypothetical protein